MYNNDRVNTRVELMNTLRKLWEQHIMWTRAFIISNAENIEDLSLVTERLLRNPDDFANVLMPFYGNQNAEKFKEALSQHLLISADLVNAAKRGDTSAAAEHRKKWYTNADDIANFLASINPYWTKQMWQAMLYDHLKTTEDEAVARLNGNYATDIKVYDSIEEQALKMADFMSEGIIRQFRL